MEFMLRKKINNSDRYEWKWSKMQTERKENTSSKIIWNKQVNDDNKNKYCRVSKVNAKAIFQEALNLFINNPT